MGSKCLNKSKIQNNCKESFDPIFFRLLEVPKRLGLGQKVPGKHPFGPNEPRFMGPKKTGPRKDQNGPKNGNFAKIVFCVLAIKWAKQGVFIYLRVPEESQKHNKDIGKG